MGTLHTPRYGFPWPDGSERVMDGDNAIGALAAAVEAAVGVHGDVLTAMTPNLIRSTGQLVLTQAYQVVPGCVLNQTPTTTETLLIVGIFDVNVTTAGIGQVFGTINIDGTARPGQATFGLGPTGVGQATAVYACLAAITPKPVGQSTVVDLRARKTAAAGVANVESVNNSSNLIVVRFRTTALRALADELGDTLDLPTPS